MYRLLRPLLFALDPEHAHGMVMRAAGLLERMPARSDSSPDNLSQELLGLTFPNPVGLAAGFDKNGLHVGAWPALGFGFCEIGSVTSHASRGNPRPRAFRLRDDRALVNRMGLNNIGAERVRESLDGRERRVPLGINVAKTHDPEIMGEAALDDFAHTVRLLAPHADYLALNVSCPNTAEGKTFEEPAALAELLTRVRKELAEIDASAPLLVKVSPPPIAPGGQLDFGPLEDVIDVSLEHQVSGFIATNTASDRVNLATDPRRLARIGDGGLSGRPLRERANWAVRHVYRKTDGSVPIIGVGGIESPDTAYERIRAGASLLQLYTGLIYEGPWLVRRINRGLARLLERDGHGSIADAVGTALG